MRDKDYKISVIVPMYNAENSISRCVNSLIMQSYTNLEIILVDNHSGDSTYDIAKKLEQQDGRIKVYQCDVQGPGAARNCGLEHVSGEFVAFIDSDDYLERDAYSRVIRQIQESESDIVLFGYYKVDFAGKRSESRNYITDGYYSGEKYQQFILDMIFAKKGKNVPAYVYLRVIKRQLIEAYKIRFDEKVRRSEDFQFLVKAHIYARSMSVIYSHKLYAYYETENSITHSYMPGYQDMIKRIFEDLDKVTAKFTNEELKRRLDYKYAVYMILAFENEQNSGYRLRKKLKREFEIIHDQRLRRIKKEIKYRDGIQNIGCSYFFLKLGSVVCFYLYAKVKDVLNE